MNACYVYEESGSANDDWAFGTATVYFGPAAILAEVALSAVDVWDTIACGACGFMGYTSQQPDGSDVPTSFGDVTTGGPYVGYVWDPSMSSFTMGVGVLNQYIQYRIVMQVW